MLQVKFANAYKALCGSMIDREDEISCLLVALVAGEHPLFVGPPGSAKSLLCDAISSIVDGCESFQRLITKYSEPSELFGPISIKGLKEDRLEHVVDGFLPTAHVAFVDEIGKASPAIINSLLTILNERRFDNGPKRIACPLLMLMGASNEWPIGEGFETCAAMFDRFLIRKAVSYVSPMSVDRLIWGQLQKPGKCLDLQDVLQAQREAAALQWSRQGVEAMLEIVDSLRLEGIRPSDRRLRKSAVAAKAVAWLKGANAVGADHLEILQHVLWEDPQQHPAKVAEVVVGIANPSARGLAQLLQEAQELMSTINVRHVEERTYTDVAKLREIANRLKAMGGERAEMAFGKVSDALKRYNAILLGA